MVYGECVVVDTDALKCSQSSERTSIWLAFRGSSLFKCCVSSSQWMTQRARRKCSVRTKSWSSTQQSSFSIAKTCASYGSALMRLGPRAPKRLVVLAWFCVRISTLLLTHEPAWGHLIRSGWIQHITRRFCAWCLYFCLFMSYLYVTIEHSTSLGFPCLSLLMTTLFLSWLREFLTYKQLSPLPQQRDIYIIQTLMCCSLDFFSLTFQKVFSVWPLAKQWIGDIENNAHWRPRKLRMVLIVGNNWQCDSDSSPAQIGQIVHSLSQSSGKGPLVQ